MVAVVVGACFSSVHALKGTYTYTSSQFEYRLSTCSNICIGLFCSIVPSKVDGFPLPTFAVANVVETGRADNARMVLFGHVIATLGNGPVVTDEDMAYPENWRDQKSSKDSRLGHKVMGRTVCLHSFAILPKVQNCGLGRLLMKAYLQQINESGIADRVALICQDVSFPTSPSPFVCGRC